MDFNDKALVAATTEQAHALIAALSSNNSDQVRVAIDGLTRIREASLFSEVGKLTRKLHEAIVNFDVEDKITDAAAHGIPDATDRLLFVIKSTQEAANKTMDCVENTNKIVDSIRSSVVELKEEWSKLKRRELKPGDFRTLAGHIDEFFIQISEDSDKIADFMTDAHVAQNYQDITGQIIQKVISLVHDVEISLVDLIKMFGNLEKLEFKKKEVVIEAGAEGPVIDKERKDTLKDQDEVDDLLSSLGF